MGGNVQCWRKKGSAWEIRRRQTNVPARFLRGQDSISPASYFVPVGGKSQHVPSQIHPKSPIFIESHLAQTQPSYVTIFPAKKLIGSGWLWIHPRFTQNLLKDLSTSRKLLITPVSGFRFLQKPETKQDFLGFLFGQEVLQALIMRPQGNTRKRQTHKEKSWRQVTKEKKTQENKYKWVACLNCKIIDNILLLKMSVWFNAMPPLPVLL